VILEKKESSLLHMVFYMYKLY